MLTEPPSKKLKSNGNEQTNNSAEAVPMEIDTDSPEINIEHPENILSYDILNDLRLNIKRDMIIDLNNETEQQVNVERKIICKIIKFSGNSLESIRNFSSKDFPNLFVFIADVENFEIQKEVEESLRNFFRTRSLILQLTSRTQNMSKIVHRLENSNNFKEVIQQISTNVNPQNFEDFLNRFVSGSLNCTYEHFVNMEESALIIRFLRLYECPDNFDLQLANEIAQKGTKKQLMALLDEPFEEGSRTASKHSQTLISHTLNITNNQESVLSIALKVNNNEIVDYLISQQSHLIQQLPMDHQVYISDITFQSKMFEVLYELLKTLEFPFPFPNSIVIEDTKLNELVAERNGFFFAIQNENFQEIKNFIDDNPHLKIVYNLDNRSALFHSDSPNKTKVYCYLKAHGFQTAPNEDFENGFDVDKRKLITTTNVEILDKNIERSVLMLESRSFIHNKRISKPDEKEFRRNIKTYYNEIHDSKFGRQLIKVTAQCENLSIIFDFESDVVNNVDRIYENRAVGTTHAGQKWIFIAAKITKNNQHSKIRSTIAHEFCHYSNFIVFENNARPYHLSSNADASKFTSIVNDFSKYKNTDDKCCGIISKVYINYQPDHYHQELIVTVAEVLAYFYGDESKIEEITRFHQDLFRYYEDIVVKAFEAFSLEDSEGIRKFNKIVGIMPEFNKCNIQLGVTFTHINFMEMPVVIVTTNSPKLLMYHIHLYLKYKHQNLYDTKAVMVNTITLRNDEMFKDFTEILMKKSALASNIINFNAIFDFTEEMHSQIESFCGASAGIGFIFVTTGDKLSILTKIFNHKNISYQSLQANYAWSDLTSTSQMTLTQERVSFQGNTGNTFYSLIFGNDKMNQEQLEERLKAMSIDETIESNENGRRVIFDVHENAEITDDTHDSSNYQKDNDQSTSYAQSSEITSESIFGSSSCFTISRTKNIGNLFSQEPSKSASCTFENNVFPNTEQAEKSNTYEKENKTEQNTAVLLKSPEQGSLENLSDIIGDELLNLLIKKSKISINSNFHEQLNMNENFKCIFKPRNFLEKGSKNISRTISNEEYELFNSIKKYEDFEVVDKDKVKVTEILSYIKNLGREKLIKNVMNKKYVLISDIAGSGKSWALKSVVEKLNQVYVDKWMIYLDLKKHVEAFKLIKDQVQFTNFLINKVMKFNFSYEAKVFKKMFEMGRVFAFFDGFDEISPDCAESVTKLIESFDYNDGNQMWITTRDYFEVDLKNILKQNKIYKLDKFSDDYAVDLIASTWALKDIKDNNIEQHQSEHSSSSVITRSSIENSPNFSKYQVSAREIVEKISKVNDQPIGFPQFYTIIAEINEDDRNQPKYTNLYNMYSECVDKHYEKALQRGSVRLKNSAKILRNIEKIHQYYAMKGLFANSNEFCDIKGKPKCSDEEIKAFGLLIETGFIHETYREFHAADFIVRIMRESLWMEYLDFFIFLIKFLTVHKFDVVRMFLNDARIGSTIEENQINDFVKKFSSNWSSDCDFLWIFKESLENLVEFLITMLDNENFEGSKNFVALNLKNIVESTTNASIFIKFTDFMIKVFTNGELKASVNDLYIFHKIAESRLDSEAIEYFTAKIVDETDREFVKKCLISDKSKRNILYSLVTTDTFNELKFKMFFKILKDNLLEMELNDMIFKQLDTGFNILHITMLTKNEIILKTVWNEIKDFLSKEKFEELLKVSNQIWKNIVKPSLFFAAYCNKLEFHKTLWELLTETFTDLEKFKDLLLNKDIEGKNSLIHTIVSLREPGIINFTFKKIKEIFNIEQYQEIMNDKGHKDRNYLQKAADFSENISSHKALWKIISEYSETYENFLKILSHKDSIGLNVFGIAATFSTKNVFDFMIETYRNIYIEKFNTLQLDDIKDLLENENNYEQNILQSAVLFNNDLQLHETVWTTIDNIFERDEIVEFIEHIDHYGKHLMHEAVYGNNLEVIAFTWKKIEGYIEENERGDYLNIITKYNMTLYDIACLKNNSIVIDWVEDLLTKYT